MRAHIAAATKTQAHLVRDDLDLEVALPRQKAECQRVDVPRGPQRLQGGEAWWLVNKTCITGAQAVTCLPASDALPAPPQKAQPSISSAAGAL